MNAAPVFASPAALDVTEPGPYVFYNAYAGDPEGSPVTYTIAGGADAAQFNLTPAGALSFKTTRSFENPADADADNIYEITIAASDGAVTSNLALKVTVKAYLADYFFALRDQAKMDVGCLAGDNIYRDFRIAFVDTSGKVFLNKYFGAPRTLAIDLSNRIAPNGVLDCAWGGLTDPGGPPIYRHLLLSVINRAGDLELLSLRLSDSLGSNLDSFSVVPYSLITIPRTGATNNGGGVASGPDGIYLAVGDFGNPDAAQSSTSLAGKLIRFPIRSTADNFTTREIVASGLRNPASMNIQRRTADNIDYVYIGDRGVEREEIDMIPLSQRNANFGWPFFDGTRVARAGAPAGLTAPVIEYEHGTSVQQGSAVVAGVVTSAGGRPTGFLFGDRASGNIWVVTRENMVLGRTIFANRFIAQRPAIQFSTGTYFPGMPAPALGRLRSVRSGTGGVIVIADEEGNVGSY